LRFRQIRLALPELGGPLGHLSLEFVAGFTKSLSGPFALKPRTERLRDPVDQVLLLGNQEGLLLGIVDPHVPEDLALRSDLRLRPTTTRV
jgi:hypothetical protein